ncbi:methylenetetrahydrofolate reductase [Candidatus Viridilinea mediisalina]|uniref:Methylenetetrahydrofolate reductase n=1 Tax=Candidatus Viridilinea mediisalina TaxID=2024553 RepID=A0A2A6REI7_9CHLR|nr:hypothetical protein [Candidatus Viridilinea mediisalina]PDW01394.1 hypothetical protein CJ255_19170 [Candidatus Viridilinea mediisalina]
MTLHETMTNPRRFALLYGTTPPRADAPADRVLGAAARLAQRVAGLPLDGLVVYDVQDETSRTAEPRPFPFLPTLEAPNYGKLLHQLVGKPIITYKCIAAETEATWPGWLDHASRQHGVRYLSLVGLASSRDTRSSLALSRATLLAAAHPAGFVLGGVAIAERHSATRSESQRLIAKARHGCSYFISQAVYDAAPTIQLLSDYVRDCAEQGVTPRRIVLDFVPVGRPQTMSFMRWLGIAIPDATARAILDDAAPLSRSLAICRELLQRILDQPYADQLPLGVAVESVSINRAEIGATIELLHILREVAQERGLLLP